MLATYASAALIVVASLIVGRAIMLALGRPTASYLEGAVGVAVLIVVAAIAIRLPGEGDTSVAATGLITFASLIFLAMRREGILGHALGVGAPPALLTLLLCSFPFLASNHFGIPGVGVNNDFAAHLLYTDYLQDPSGPVPAGVENGYPIGPHALAATVAQRLGIEPRDALLGVLLAAPVLTAITSLAFLREMPPVRRTLLASLVAVPYMAASTLGIAGFKELLAGLFLVAIALGLREISRGEPGRNAILAGIAAMIAGTVAAYSFPGLAWPAAAIGAWALAELIRAAADGPPGAVRDLIRRAAPVGLPALGVVAVLGLIQLPRLIDFLNSHIVGIVRSTDSKLRFAVSPFEALGIWPSGDFLLGTSDVSSVWIFALIGVAALAFALWWWVRDRDLAIPAAVIGAAIIYLGILLAGGRYAESKALAVPASLVMLLILGALFGRDGGSWPKRILAVAFVAVAAYSSFLALRDAVVAPPTRFEELSDLRGQVEGRKVISLTSDRFADYGLRGAEVFSPARNAEHTLPARDSKDQRLPVDFDTALPESLNDFPFAVTTSAEYQSQAPPGFERADETDSYVLWQRTGTVPNIDDLHEEARPGRIFRCREPKVGPLLGESGEATVLTPRPVVAKRLYWDPSKELSEDDESRAAILKPGETAMQTRRLPPGDWELSLQYASPVSDVTLSAPGLTQTLPAGVEAAIPYRPDQGPYWRAGTIHSDGGKIDFTVHAEKLNRLQQLLGVDAPAIIGNLTAVQLSGIHTQSLRDSCYEYVDHFVHTVPGDILLERQLKAQGASVAEQKKAAPSQAKSIPGKSR